jgi:DNA repair protein RecO (recombination protein O)
MEAIVLSRRDFREYDQIITVYTKEQGKLELLARGVKKIVSKNTAHLEPFSYGMIESVPGKEILHLTTAQPLHTFPFIRSNLEFSLGAQIIVKIVDTIVQVGERDQRIFSLIKKWLFYVETIAVFNYFLIDGFVMSLLSLLGFSPIIDKCVVCEKKFSTMIKEELNASDNKKRGGLYFAGGGLVCPNCRELKQSVGEEIETCGLKEISILQILLSGDFNIIDRNKINEAEVASVHTLVMNFAAYHTERKLPNWTDFCRYGIMNNNMTKNIQASNNL